MPSWGRPSGARQAKRRKDRGVYTQQKEEALRFEEIDSDSDDGQGVNVESSFASDELRFTGADLGAHMRTRQRQVYEDDSDTSDENYPVVSETSGGTMQLALKDKEDLLVQKALERIRRAQALGKTNVKLSQPELDALERKRRRDQSKRRTSGVNLRLADKRQSSGTSSPALREQKSGNEVRKSSLPRHDRGDALSAKYTAAPPGLLLPGQDVLSHAPFGYYPSADFSEDPRPNSSSRISPPLRRKAPNVPHYTKPRDKTKRNSSGIGSARQSPPSDMSDPSRRLPDDPSWSPRPRSASSYHPYVTDPYQYQQYSPSVPQMPPQHTQNRRIVSGPPDVLYPDVQRRAAYPAQQPYAASSEPSLLHREYRGGQQAEAMESDYESGDSEDDGVQVDVVPYGRGYGVRVEPQSPVNRQRRDQR